jgi:hypothetical protein
VISCHSRDIGIGCLKSCNHCKDDGRGYVQYHGKEGYCDSSCACKLDIYFVSVKYVFVCIKLMCVYVKLLKI